MAAQAMARRASTRGGAREGRGDNRILIGRLHRGEHPDPSTNASPPTRVLRDGDYWVMFYFGLAADGHAREGYATSRDLRSWEKSGEILLDIGPVGSIDSTHTHKPAVIAWEGRLEHYYCAVSPQEDVLVGEHAQSERRGIARATGPVPHP